MAVLFITHDMGVVAEIADRTVVMYRSQALETGTTEAIFQRSQHPYTRALLSAVPQLGGMKDHARPTAFPIVDVKTGQLTTAARKPRYRRARQSPSLRSKTW